MRKNFKMWEIERILQLYPSLEKKGNIINNTIKKIETLATNIKNDIPVGEFPLLCNTDDLPAGTSVSERKLLLSKIRKNGNKLTKEVLRLNVVIKRLKDMVDHDLDDNLNYLTIQLGGPTTNSPGGPGVGATRTGDPEEDGEDLLP